MQDIVSYRLLIAIEALCLCYHISARRLKEVLEEYAEGLTILSKVGPIPREVSEMQQKTARFRDVLVHMLKKRFRSGL